MSVQCYRCGRIGHIKTECFAKTSAGGKSLMGIGDPGRRVPWEHGWRTDPSHGIQGIRDLDAAGRGKSGSNIFNTSGRGNRVDPRTAALSRIRSSSMLGGLFGGFVTGLTGAPFRNLSVGRGKIDQTELVRVVDTTQRVMMANPAMAEAYRLTQIYRDMVTPI